MAAILFFTSQDHLVLGSTFSLRAMSRAGESCSIVDYMSSGSSLSVRSYLQIGSTLSTRSFAAQGSGCSIFYKCIVSRASSPLSVVDKNLLGSSMSLRSYLRSASSATLLDFMSMGSLLSIRCSTKFGSSLSIGFNVNSP